MILHGLRLSQLPAEFLAIAMVVETRVRTLGRVDQLCVAAVCAVLLAANLSNRLGRRTYLVNHAIFCLALPDLCPNNGHFFLWNTNRLVALWAKVATHLDSSMWERVPG